MLIRAWVPADATAVTRVLDPDPDPYWSAQRAGVHGVASRPDRYACTLVAEDAEGVVGIATLYENLLHPGRYPATVEVRPDARRRGIGRRLVSALLGQRPAARPLEVRLRDANGLAMAFAESVGMRRFQHCPVPTVDPHDPAVRGWVRSIWTTGPAQPLSAVQPTAVVDAVVRSYEWNHADWAPIGTRARIESVWAEAVQEADPQLSSVTLVGGRIAAHCLVWPGEPTSEAVAETTRRHQPGGIDLVTGCVARSLATARTAECTPIVFDGHDDDSHFAPVLATVPATRDPVSLLELV